MGASLSCLDPARENPPFSWPKDHPGRAEAIAEYKARRTAGKFTKKAAKKESAKPVVPVAKDISAVDAAPIEQKEVVNEKDVPVKDATSTGEAGDDVEETEVKDLTVDPALKVEEKTIEEAQKEDVVAEEDIGVPTQADEVVEDVIVEDGAKVQDAIVEPLAVHPAQEEEETPIVEVVAKTAEPLVAQDAPETPVAVEAPVEVEAPVKVEAPVEVEAPVGVKDPVEVESPVEVETPVELEANLQPDSDLAPEPSAEVQMDAQAETFRASAMRPVSATIDDRRAIFENKPDTLPVVSELAMDIQDPVTGEYVTLAEYRKRQKERAQGVVKEQVDKFEHLDELAMKEKATQQLQVDSRQKTVRSWTKPDSSSTPSSPIEPRKMGELDLPEDTGKN